MSTTSIYSVFKTKANCIGELRNGHGSAIALWEYISQKYRGKRFDLFDHDDNFFDIWKTEGFSDKDKIVLFSTYDDAYVEIERLEEYAEACREIHDSIIRDTEWTWNHFRDIADIAEKLFISHDYRSLGLGIGCTSVCDPWMDFDEKKIWGVYS